MDAKSWAVNIDGRRVELFAARYSQRAVASATEGSGLGEAIAVRLEKGTYGSKVLLGRRNEAHLQAAAVSVARMAGLDESLLVFLGLRDATQQQLRALSRSLAEGISSLAPPKTEA